MQMTVIFVLLAHAQYTLIRLKLMVRSSESQLFITHQKPHKRASRDTIRRWIQQMMIRAGIDATVYRPLGVRSASASKANVNDASLMEIIKTAGWGSAARFYDGKIEPGPSFATTVPVGGTKRSPNIEMFHAVGLKCVRTSRTGLLLNLSPVSEISAVNLIVGLCLFACSMNCSISSLFKIQVENMSSIYRFQMSGFNALWIKISFFNLSHEDIGKGDCHFCTHGCTMGL